MNHLIESASYMAHGYCLLWQPWLVTLYAGSDLLIFLSYLAIPIALLVFLKRRPELRYRGLVSLFAAFILLCGLTHLLSIITLWVPIYPLVGVVKLATGLVSAATAVVLFTLIPRLVKIPSPDQLQAVVSKLEQEAASHKATMAKLEEARLDLERKVAERTGELTEANSRLTIVTREALHRVRNLLTVVTSLARQTARSAPDVDAFLESFSGRLDALARATSAISRDSDNRAADFRDVVENQLEPIVAAYGPQVSIDGPAVKIDPEAAQQIGLALHELGTNAVKYGALSGQSGKVEIRWSIEPGPKPELRFSWTESGPAPGSAGKPSGARGFGARLLSAAVPAFLDGTAEHDLSSGNLRYILTAPMSKISPADTVEERPYIGAPAFAN